MSLLLLFHPSAGVSISPPQGNLSLHNDPVTFDAQSTSVTTGSGTSFTDTGKLTVGSGPNRALVVTIIWAPGSQPADLVVTWNGVACTLIPNTNISNSNGIVNLFGLLNPDSGANALAASWTGSRGYYFAGASFQNVNQSDLDTAFKGSTNSGTSTSASIVVPSNLDEDAISQFCVVSGDITGITSGTQIWLGGANLLAGVRIDGASPSVTMSASLSPSAAWAVGGSRISSFMVPNVSVGIVASYDISPPQGNVVLSPIAPSVVRTAHRDIVSPQGNAVLSSIAPASVVDFNRLTLHGNVSLSLTAPSVVKTNNIFTPQGDVVLSPTTPSVVRTDHRNITSPQGNVVLSPTASSVIKTAHIFANSLQGIAVISSNAPDVQAGAGVGKSPPQSELTLSPTLPIVVQTTHRNITSPQGAVVLSPIAPAVIKTANIFANSLQGNLAISANAPDVQAGAGVGKSPPQGEMVLSITAPVLILSAHRNLVIPQGNVALSSVAPSATIAISAFPIQGNLAISPTAPASARTAHVFANSLQGNLALSPTVPTKVVDAIRLLLQGNIVLSPTAPAVVRTAHRNIIVPQGDIGLSAEAPSTGGAMTRLPLQGNFILSSTASTVVRTAHHNISPPTRDLLLSPIAPIFFASDIHPIIVPQANLALSTLPAQLIPGQYVYPIATDLSLTTSSPIIIFEKIHHWNETISLQGRVILESNLTGSSSYEKRNLLGNIGDENNLLGNINNNQSLDG